jgi:exosortase/archaeosortase family protein
MLRRTLNAVKYYYQWIMAVALLTALVFVVYGSDLQIIINEALQSEEMSYVLILPFFLAVLLYARKDTVKAVHDLDSSGKTRIKYVEQLMGVAVILIAFLTYWYGSLTFYALNYHILSIPIFLIGVTLVLTGVNTTLRLLPPILFLLFLVPIPTQALFALGGTLANLNTQAAYALLKAFNLPVQLNTTYGPPTLVLTATQTAPTTFAVDLPCSGIYSLISFTMFAVFLLLIAKGSITRKIGLVATGAILFEALNVFRISAIIGAAYQFGEQIAMTFLHPMAGFLLIFAGMLITLGIAERLFKIQIITTKATSKPCPECENSLKSLQTFCTSCGKHLRNTRICVSREAYGKLLLLILISFLITLVISAPTFSVAQGLEVTAPTDTGTKSTDVFPNITGYSPITFFYRDYDYEKLAQQDASLWYAYYSSENELPTVYVDINVAGSISNLHNWEVCLYSWQIAQGETPIVSVLDSRDVQLIQETPIIAQFFTFVSPYNYTQITLYWYEKAAFNTGTTVEQRYVRVSLVALTDNSTTYKQLEDQVQPIGAAIATFWQPMRDNGLLTLGVPTIQTLLMLSVAVVASAETAQTLAERKRRTTNQRLFYSHATQQEKTLLQTVQKLAARKEMIRTEDIQRTLAETEGDQPEFETLQTMLRSLEQYGFIKKEVKTLNNQTYLAWKSMLDNVDSE